MGLFDSWRNWRNKCTLVPNIPKSFLDMSKEELCEVMKRFVLEVKKQDGKPYPPNTLYEIVMALQSFLHQNFKEWKFLNDVEFKTLRNTLDTKMKELSSEGLRPRRRQAEVITEEEEEKLWSSFLGAGNPTQLLHTVVYLLGLHFALRAGNEHRNLRHSPTSQLQLRRDSCGRRFLAYTEDVSKTQQGGLNHRKIAPKEVHAYENTSDRSRCLVTLYELYCSLRPEAFYLRPLQKPSSSSVWYAKQPIGRNYLAKVVPHWQELSRQSGASALQGGRDRGVQNKPFSQGDRHISAV